MGVIGYNLQHAVLADRPAVSPNVGKHRGEQGDFPPNPAVCPDFLIVPDKGKSLVRGSPW
jgi:hypothetical protein